MKPESHSDARRKKEPGKSTIKAILAQTSCELIRTHHPDRPARYYAGQRRISAATYHRLGSLADRLECFWTRSRRATDGLTYFRHGLTVRFHPRRSI